MARKTTIIKNAFDKLYADLGHDLSSLLGSRLRDTGKSWKGYGIKWTYDRDANWFLLEVTPDELNAILKSEKSYSITPHVFLTAYKAHTHEPNSFLLRKEIGTNKLDLLYSILSFFDSLTFGSKIEPYISSEERGFLLQPSKDSSHVFPQSSNDHKPITLRPSIGPSPIDSNVIDSNDVVIVDYAAPFDSFSYHGAIHLEINRKNHTITSKGWLNGEYPLLPPERQEYLDFFSDLKNLYDFFGDGTPLFTPAERCGAHFRWYELRIQWRGNDKKISIGEPISFKHPFWH